MQVHPLIETSTALAEFVGLIKDSDFIAVDTEFMRENTFWPELCLIQVANSEHAAAIDPMANGIDLKPLLDLLVDNEEVLKVFHAGGQDVEIIFNLTGKTPHPIFDTQIGQMALGQAEQVGYSNLVEAWLGIVLDKGARFTDWSRRPLDKRQIDYAIGDVTHLAEIFPMMLKKLVKTGRGHWLDEEMEKLADPANYNVDPEKAWLRIKVPSRKPDVLGRLKALAAWREREARTKNLPRGRIVKDETLGDLAAHPPKDQDGLGRVRGLSATWKSNDIGARLMDALDNAKPLPKDDMPDRAPRGPGLGKEGVLVADLLKLLLKIRARELNVASRLIARSDDLEALAAGRRDDIPMMQGWRYDVFGHAALDLVEGRMGFAVKNGKLVMSEIDAAAAAPIDDAGESKPA
ncbi:ribonuclease D [Sphingopyxis macrogoltabida]|uniref:Ribonuclease D n=1 Tax=Sphingopyxis macrogoltabida TaxID=33050 RepID=A0A0N9UCG0_SPHMC|nr:ribonuclease D [Sphingopyxis macrogoltabida]ALH81042.1 ribonuclease D [Sphingopyxis macrogoltabida]